MQLAMVLELVVDFVVEIFKAWRKEKCVLMGAIEMTIELILWGGHVALIDRTENSVEGTVKAGMGELVEEKHIPGTTGEMKRNDPREDTREMVCKRNERGNSADSQVSEEQQKRE